MVKVNLKCQLKRNFVSQLTDQNFNIFVESHLILVTLNLWIFTGNTPVGYEGELQLSQFDLQQTYYR